MNAWMSAYYAVICLLIYVFLFGFSLPSHKLWLERWFLHLVVGDRRSLPKSSSRKAQEFVFPENTRSPFWLLLRDSMKLCNCQPMRGRIGE